ncbi:MAG: outer membrane protein assembly factor BamD [Victivallaceae bacterium]|nr:outer membrane protein assembly factor BamD [Victivallaceae bacterium]
MFGRLCLAVLSICASGAVFCADPGAAQALPAEKAAETERGVFRPEGLLNEAFALREAGNHRDAAEKFLEAEVAASDPVMRANAAGEAAASFGAAKLAGREFEVIERMLENYSGYVDYAKLAAREYDLGDFYYAGKREPAFWSLRFVPWLSGPDRMVEIYEKALTRAPFGPQANRARLRLARYYLNEAKNDVAIAHLREVVKNAPDSSEGKFAMLGLGEVLLELARRGDGDGRYHYEAVELFSKFKEKYPDAPENDWAEKQLLRSRDIRAQRLVDIADFYRKNGRDLAAERCLNEVVREYSDTPQASASERKLVQIDRSFVPDPHRPEIKDRVQRYEAFRLPEEERKLLVSPDESNGKYLLPVYDLGIGPKQTQGKKETNR